MGAAIDAYGTGLSVTIRNPAFVILAFVVFVVSLPISLILAYIPLLGPLLQMVVFVPFVSAVVLGMAYAGIVRGSGILDAAVQSLKENYVSLAGAYGLLFAVNMAVWFVLAILGVVLLLFGTASFGALESAGSNPESAAGALLAGSLLFIVFGLIVFLVALVAGLFLQFIDVAIVVGGESATSTFGASWRLFTSGPLSVIGYSILRGLTVVVAAAIVGLFYGLGSLAGSDEIALGLAGLGLLVVGPLTAAFYFAYHAAYYHERVGGRSLDEDESPPAQPTTATTASAGSTQGASGGSGDSDPLL